MTDFCKISYNLVVQILSRLPPKALMRFKCIHKSWQTQIENPKFVAKHLSNTMDNQLSSAAYILFKRFVNDTCDSTEIDKETVFSKLNFCYDNDWEEHNTCTSVEDVLNAPLSMYLKMSGQHLELEILESGRFICHCDGIICLAGYSYNLLLCNLATKEFKLVPDSCLPLPPLEMSKFPAVGFGHDPNSNNYKVIRILSYGEEECADDRIVVFPPKAEVYVLGTDSWQDISTEFLETETTIFWPMYSPFHFKGLYYWMGFEQKKEFENCYFKSDHEYIRELIVFFDARREIFSYILLPDVLYGPVAFSSDMQLAAWNESIALLGLYSIDQEPEDTSLGIWVMDDGDGVDGSWNIKFSFQPPVLNIQGTLQLWKTTEILMMGPDESLISYNLNTKEIKPLSFDRASPFQILVCINSIVSVMGSNKRQQKWF